MKGLNILKDLSKNSDSLDGTSRISLMVPNMQVSKLRSFITYELTTAKNIKSRINRQSVISSLKSVESHIVDYKQIPDNGIAIYCMPYV